MPKNEFQMLMVNGVAHPWVDGLTAGKLIDALRLDQSTVVVECNGKILTPAALIESPLAAGDVVEIVHFVGGG
jgi:thiamine biosynthesis protein ThiS